MFQQIARESAASQDWFELWQLLELLSQDPPKKVLEIGVHRGGLLESMRRAFPESVLYGVDVSFDELEFPGFMQFHGDSNDANTRNLIFERVGRADFVFVDGDHSYKAIMTDYEFYAPLVDAGGIMAFHDIMRAPDRVPHHAGVEARKAFDEIKKRHASIEIWNGTAGDNGPGIGVIFL